MARSSSQSRLSRPLICALLLTVLCAGGFALWESDWMLEREAAAAGTQQLAAMAARMPGSAIVQYHYGRRLAADGDTAGAIGALQRANQDDPGSGRIAALLGDQLARVARFHEAAALLQRYARRRPNDPDVLYALGLYYYRVFSHQQAIESLQKAAALAPRDVRVWRLLGEAQTAFGRYTDAIASYTQAQRLDPADADTLLHRATARRMRSDITGAEADIRAAIQLAPARPDLAYALGELLARYRRDPASLNEAERALRRLVDGNAAIPEARRELARVYCERHDWAAAANELAAFTATKPDDAEALYLYAEALARLGKPNAAVMARYRRAKAVTEERKNILLKVQSEPNNITARRQEAEFLAAHGERAFAILEYERILRQSPGDVPAQQALMALRGRKD